MGVQKSAKVWYVVGSLILGLCDYLFRLEVKKSYCDNLVKMKVNILSVEKYVYLIYRPIF